jgi:hypothetical protein
MNEQATAYDEKNSQKPGKIALKRTRPTVGSPPLGRSRAPANGQSPLQTKLSSVGPATPRRAALGTAPRPPGRRYFFHGFVPRIQPHSGAAQPPLSS